MVAFPRFSGVEPLIDTLAPAGSDSAVRPPRLPALDLPVLAAAAAGVVVAGATLLMPGATLEALVVASGVPALLTVAEPPLGATARLLLAIGGGTLAAAVTWAALFLLFGPDGLVPLGRIVAGDEDAPSVRRADAHPDAPPRRPLSASDLGPPMPPVGATTPLAMTPRASGPEPAAATSDAPLPGVGRPDEQTLPADLDVPLAAFDPDAIPDLPREPVCAVEPLAPKAMPAEMPPPLPPEPLPPTPRPIRAPAMAPGERLEVFALTPRPIGAPGTDGSFSPSPSIAALLDRLENAARRPPASAPAPAVETGALDETLAPLRRIAARG